MIGTSEALDTVLHLETYKCLSSVLLRNKHDCHQTWKRVGRHYQSDWHSGAKDSILSGQISSYQAEHVEERLRCTQRNTDYLGLANSCSSTAPCSNSNISVSIPSYPVCVPKAAWLGVSVLACQRSTRYQDLPPTLGSYQTRWRRNTRSGKRIIRRHWSGRSMTLSSARGRALMVQD